MSQETLKNLEKAIHDHMNACYDTDSVLTDWFVGYGLMTSTEDGIGFSFDYAGSDTSPQGVLGIGKLNLEKLESELIAARFSADNDSGD